MWIYVSWTIRPYIYCKHSLDVKSPQFNSLGSFGYCSTEIHTFLSLDFPTIHPMEYELDVSSPSFNPSGSLGLDIHSEFWIIHSYIYYGVRNGYLEFISRAFVTRHDSG